MNPRYPRSGLTLLSLLIPCMHVQAAPNLTVVELYTSEGCSSCPPAEEYLGELAGRSDVLPLAFHVDYWDNLGWRDPYALPTSTARQRGYSASLKLDTIFTPQVIVGGRASLVGSDRHLISESLRAAQAASVALTLTQEDGRLVISASPSSDDKPSDLLLVPFRRHVKSAIARGENQGRTVDESNIVRELRVIGHTRGEALQLQIPLSSLPKDATDVAVLAQRPRQGEIVGAVRLALDSSRHF